MTDKFVTALNTISGQVGLVPADYLTHPFFKDQLVEVDADQKSYDPALYSPKTADEYRTANAKRAKVEESDKPLDKTGSTDNEKV